MNDYRDMIGSDASFDDPKYWRFARRSGLPRGYFDRPRINIDSMIVIVCAAIAVGMIAVLIGERL